MPGDDALLKGGLLYEINVGGNFEERLRAFESKVADLEKRSSSLGSTIKSSGAGASGRSASAQAVTDGRAQEVIQKKLVQLQDKLLLAQEGQIKAQRVITELAQRLQDTEVKNAVLRKEITQQQTIQKQATLANTAAEQKGLVTQERILQAKKDIAKQQGKINAQTVADKTGLTPGAVTKADKEIAQQAAQVKAQEKLVEKQISLAEELEASKTKGYEQEMRDRTADQQAFKKEQDALSAEINKSREKSDKAEVAERAKITKELEKQNLIRVKNAEMQAKVVEYSKQHRVSEYDAARALGLSASRAKMLGFELKKADSFVSNFFFTFRRLVGILAIFTLARKFAQFLSAGVKEMSRFNALLEQTKLSFASIIASVGEINDSNGRQLDSIEKYNAALAVSQGLTRQIRTDALTTVATFEELLGAFQAGIAPGLQAGLDINQVEEVTTKLVKAASVLGVQGSKFTEEIRSVLAGTGTARNTQLYKVLPKDELKRAKDAGQLYEYLVKKLEPFEIASGRVAKSWDGLVSQIKDGVSTLLSEGGVEYFETLKGSMEGLVNALVDMEKIKAGYDLGDVINKDALGGVQEISTALADLIKEFAGVTSIEETFFGIRMVLAAVGENLRLIVGLAAPLLVGFARVLSVVTGVDAALLKIRRAMFSFIPSAIISGFKNLLTVVGSVLGLFVAWAAIQKGINFLLGITNTLFGTITVLQKLGVALTAAWTAATAAWNAGLSITAVLMAAITSSATIIVAVITLIATVIGLVLYKTGLLSKWFDAINKRLGITKERIKGAAGGMTEMLFGVRATSEEVKKLEATFDDLEDKIEELANKAKAQALVNAIRGEGKTIFDAYADSYEASLNRVMKVQDELDKKNEEIDRTQKEREDQAFDQRLERARLLADMSDKEREAVMKSLQKDLKILDPESLSWWDKKMGNEAALSLQRQAKLKELQKYGGDETDLQMVAEKKKARLAELDSFNKTIQQEAEYQKLLLERKDIEEQMAEAKRMHDLELAQNLVLAQQQVDKEADGLSAINRQYDVQAQKMANIQVIDNDILKNYLEMGTEIDRQVKLLERNIQLREGIKDASGKVLMEGEVTQAEALVEAMRKEIALFDEKTKKLIEEGAEAQVLLERDKQRSAMAQSLITLEKGLAITKEQTTAQTERERLALEGLKEEYADLQADLDAQATSLDVINRKHDLAAALAIELNRRAGDAVQHYVEMALEHKRLNALAEEEQKIRETNIVKARLGLNEAYAQNATQEELNALEKDYQRKLEENTDKTRTEAAILRTMKEDLKEMADLTYSEGLAAVGVGFKEGARQFVEQTDPMAMQFADAMRNALNDVVRQAADSITDSIDPRKEAKGVRDIAADVIMGMANAMIQTVLQQFAANMLSTFFGFQSATAMNVSALGINTTALGALTGAVTALGTAFGADMSLTSAQIASTTANTAATTADTASTAVNTGATTANTGGLLASVGAIFTNTFAVIGNTAAFVVNTAMLIGQMIANVAALAFNSLMLIINAAIPFSKGGLVQGFNKGGMVGRMPRFAAANPMFYGDMVAGYASGGTINAHPRPSHISPRDTVPAWLEPGEFVIPRFRVEQLGVDFFERIRTGSLDRDAGERILASRMKAHRGVYGFAEGGAVPRPSASGGSSGGGKGTQILPVIVADNNTVDQMLAGGRKAFNRSVGEAPRGGNPNASDTWR